MEQLAYDFIVNFTAFILLPAYLAASIWGNKTDWSKPSVITTVIIIALIWVLQLPLFVLLVLLGKTYVGAIIQLLMWPIIAFYCIKQRKTNLADEGDAEGECESEQKD